MMESEARADDRKAVIRIGQRQYIAFLPSEIFEALLALQRPRLFEHGGSQIDAGDVPGHARKRTSEKPWAARDIQHRIVRAGLRHFNNAVERVFIANRRGSRKRHRLTRELI